MIASLLAWLGQTAAGGFLARWWSYLAMGVLAAVIGILWLRLETVAAERDAANANTRAAKMREGILRDSLVQTLDTLDAVEAVHARAVAALEAEAAAAATRARRSAKLMEEVRDVADPDAPVSAGIAALIDGLRRHGGARGSDAGGVRADDGAAAPADVPGAAASP